MQSREPAGDDRLRVNMNLTLNGFLNVQLGMENNTASRFVHEQNRRDEQQGAGNGEALVLAAEEPVASGSEVSIVAVREWDDEVELMRCHDLVVCGLRPGTADFGSLAVPEKSGFLENYGDLAAEVTGAEAADVNTVNTHHTFVSILQTSNQICHGGLPRSGESHETDHLARFGIKAHLAQCGLPRAVAE